VIACVGETLAQREAGETEDVLRRQVSVLEPHPRLVVAYEPVWAIGTGRTATPEQAQEVNAHIKAHLAGRLGLGGVHVQYGGSVNGQNAQALFEQPDVDGALVGGASLRSGEFSSIVAAAARTRAPA